MRILDSVGSWGEAPCQAPDLAAYVKPNAIASTTLDPFGGWWKPDGTGDVDREVWSRTP